MIYFIKEKSDLSQLEVGQAGYLLTDTGYLLTDTRINEMVKITYKWVYACILSTICCLVLPYYSLNGMVKITYR